MSVSRRGFLRILETGRTTPFSAAFLSARGLEADFAEQAAPGRAPRAQVPPGVAEIKLSSNENPLGPGKAAIDAIVGKFPEAGRYPFNSTPTDSVLVSTIATKLKTKPENVVLGAGSQEILKSAMRAFTSSTRGLVTALPTFENCTNYARKYKTPLTEVKVDSAFKLDVEQMIAAASKGGV